MYFSSYVVEGESHATSCQVLLIFRIRLGEFQIVLSLHSSLLVYEFCIYK